MPTIVYLKLFCHPICSDASPAHKAHEKHGRITTKREAVDEASVGFLSAIPFKEGRNAILIVILFSS